MFHSVKTAFSEQNLKSSTTIAGAMFAALGGGAYAISPEAPPLAQLAFYTVAIFLFLLKEQEKPLR